MARAAAVIALSSCLAVLAAAAEDGRPRLTPEHVVSVRKATDAQVSLDGRLVAFVLTEPASAEGGAKAPDSDVWIVPADGSTPARRFAATPLRENAPRFSPDGATIAFLRPAAAGASKPQVFLQRTGGSEPRPLTAAGPGVQRFKWSPDGAAVAYLAEEGTAGRSGAPDPIVVDAPEASPPRRLYVVPSTGGEARAVTSPALDVRDFAWAPDGKRFAVLAAAGPDDSERRGIPLYVVDHAGGEARRIADGATSPGTRNQVLDWSPDGRTIVFAYAAEKGPGHWLGLVPADGGPVRQLLKDDAGAVLRASFAGDSRHVLLQAFEGLRSELRRLDLETGKAIALGEILEGYPTFTASGDGRTIAYIGSTDRSPNDVWILREGTPARRLTTLNPGIEQLELGEVREFRYASRRDGTDIQGLLVLPPGVRVGGGAPPLPLITQIHGGPHFHWHRGFIAGWEDWAQLLAANGYAVFLPNPRGSTGRGWAFAGAIVHDIGGIDLADVLDGVDALVAQGLADKDRLGVGGWSYGGFMTAWTITQTDRFKAAVVGAGVSNAVSFAGQPGNGRNWMQTFFSDVPARRRDLYDQRSAVSFLTQVKTPTLVLHGERDAKISVLQGYELYNGLRTLGVETQLVVYPREGHGMSEVAHQLDFQRRVVDWYRRHIPPQS